jgi:hypothetical protein
MTGPVQFVWAVKGRQANEDVMTNSITGDKTMLRRTIIVSLASVVALVASGCNTSSSEGPVASSHDVHAGHDEPAGDDAAHPNQGPHGGHLIELGDEQYHAELLHDEAAHCTTIHLLDSAGSQPITTGPNEMRLQVLRDGQFVDYLSGRIQAFWTWS